MEEVNTHIYVTSGPVIDRELEKNRNCPPNACRRRKEAAKMMWNCTGDCRGKVRRKWRPRPSSSTPPLAFESLLRKVLDPLLPGRSFLRYSVSCSDHHAYHRGIEPGAADSAVPTRGRLRNHR